MVDGFEAARGADAPWALGEELVGRNVMRATWLDSVTVPTTYRDRYADEVLDPRAKPGMAVLSLAGEADGAQAYVTRLNKREPRLVTPLDFDEVSSLRAGSSGAVELGDRWGARIATAEAADVAAATARLEAMRAEREARGRVVDAVASLDGRETPVRLLATIRPGFEAHQEAGTRDAIVFEALGPRSAHIHHDPLVLTSSTMAHAATPGSTFALRSMPIDDVDEPPNLRSREVVRVSGEDVAALARDLRTIGPLAERLDTPSWEAALPRSNEAAGLLLDRLAAESSAEEVLLFVRDGVDDGASRLAARLAPALSDEVAMPVNGGRLATFPMAGALEAVRPGDESLVRDGLDASASHLAVAADLALARNAAENGGRVKLWATREEAADSWKASVGTPGAVLHALGEAVHHPVYDRGGKVSGFVSKASEALASLSAGFGDRQTHRAVQLDADAARAIVPTMPARDQADLLRGLAANDARAASRGRGIQAPRRDRSAGLEA